MIWKCFSLSLKSKGIFPFGRSGQTTSTFTISTSAATLDSDYLHPPSTLLNWLCPTNFFYSFIGTRHFYPIFTGHLTMWSISARLTLKFVGLLLAFVFVGSFVIGKVQDLYQLRKSCNFVVCPWFKFWSFSFPWLIVLFSFLALPLLRFCWNLIHPFFHLY